VVASGGQGLRAGEEEVAGAPLDGEAAVEAKRRLDRDLGRGLIPDEQERRGDPKQHVELLRGLGLGLQREIPGPTTSPARAKA
jgi:hypothetical protein